MPKKLYYIKDGVEMEQVFTDAGYTDQDWPSIDPNDSVFGLYEDENEGGMEVSYLDAGPSGQPEIKVEWEDGRAVTVLSVETAQGYLDRFGAVHK